VTKLNATGTALVYSTYLGGTGGATGGGIAVDAAGNAYVTGDTYSTDFPTTAGAYQTSFGGTDDAFVAKLNATGTALVYSTYLGGTGNDQATGIAVDAAGNAYVTGTTTSNDFPTTAGACQTSLGGGYYDAFVTKLNATGTALLYSTYLGGTGNDQAGGIALDIDGNAYVTGVTLSTDFPTTTGAYQTSFGSGGGDAFVAKIASDHLYTVEVTGQITGVTGYFDDSVRVGTPYTFSFLWDTSIEPGSIWENPVYIRQIWSTSEKRYGATVEFGDYGSSPAPTSDPSAFEVLKLNNKEDAAGGGPDQMGYISNSNTYNGVFPFSGYVTTSVGVGAAPGSDPFPDGDVAQHPLTDWTMFSPDSNYSGFFWRIIDSNNSSNVSIVYGNVQNVHVSVSPVTQTTTALTTSASPSTYDDSVTFTATVTSQGNPVTSGTVDFKEGNTVLASMVPLSASGTASFSTSALSAVTHTITAYYSGASAFDASSGSVQQVVNRKAATVTPSASSKVYGSSDPVLTGSTSGFLASDGVTASFSRTAGETVAGGPYTISATLSPAGVLANYDITYNTAPFTITPALLTIMPIPGQCMVYGGTVPALTYTYTGLVNGDTSATFTGGLATMATSTCSVGDYPITQGTLAATGNYTIGTFNAGTLTVTPAPLVITPTAGQSMVYGAAVPVLTYTASGFVNGDTATLLTGALGTTATPTSAVGNYPFTLGSLTAGTNYTLALAANSPTFAVIPDGTTMRLASSANPCPFGLAVTLTATVTANPPGSGSPTGTVTFYDGPVNADDQIGTGTLSISSGVMTATLSMSSLPAGTDTITATYGGDGNFLTSTGTFTITINPSVIVLDPSAGGALSLSGNACINVPGVVYVDSSSTSALSASGNAQVKAAVIDVHGKVQKSSNASFSPAPTTGAPVLADPLAGLPLPGTSGLTNYGSEILGGYSSATIRPGIYKQIAVSGNAQLTLSGGIYIIEGGGLSVSGNASVSGSGVMIVNAGSNYPAAGGTYGSITLSGTGSYNLSPLPTGSCAGIVIFQPGDNASALSISGNTSGLSGTIYAPAAPLSASGNAPLNTSLVVDTLTINGNSLVNGPTPALPAGTIAFSPAPIRSAYELATGSQDSTGQIMAIVDADDNPSLYLTIDAFVPQSGPTSADRHSTTSMDRQRRSW
jgi:hypothetical protein